MTRRAIVESVPSRSNPGTFHKVIIIPAEGHAQCDCKGFHYRGYCPHIGEVLLNHVRIDRDTWANRMLKSLEQGKVA